MSYNYFFYNPFLDNVVASGVVNGSDKIWLNISQVKDNSKTIFNNNNYKIRYIKNNDEENSYNLTRFFNENDIITTNNKEWLKFNHVNEISNNLYEWSLFKKHFFTKFETLDDISKVVDFLEHIENIHLYNINNDITNPDIKISISYENKYGLSYVSHIHDLVNKDLLDINYDTLKNNLKCSPFIEDQSDNLYITYINPVFSHTNLSKLSEDDISFNDYDRDININMFYSNDNEFKLHNTLRYSINQETLLDNIKMDTNPPTSTLDIDYSDITNIKIIPRHIITPLYLYYPYDFTESMFNQRNILDVDLNETLKQYLGYIDYLGITSLNFDSTNNIILNILEDITFDDFEYM